MNKIKNAYGRKVELIFGNAYYSKFRSNGHVFYKKRIGNIKWGGRLVGCLGPDYNFYTCDENLANEIISDISFTFHIVTKSYLKFWCK